MLRYLSAFFTACLFAVAAHAQSYEWTHSPYPVKAVFTGGQQYTAKAGFDEFVVDFDREEEAMAGAANYRRGFWQLSEKGSNPISYAVIRPDTFPKFGSTEGYALSYLTAIRLDSIDLLLAHKKLSAGNDTIIIEFSNTDASWHPLSTVFEADTLVTSTPFFTSNTLDTAYTLRLYPAIWYTGIVPVAIRIRFLAPQQDTLLLAAGFSFNGSCGINDKPNLTPFYPNSYAYYKDFNDLLPTTAGGNIYTECDGIAGQDSTADGFSPIQNWCATMYFRANTLGLDPGAAEQKFTAYPNPTTESVRIKSAEALEYWHLLSSEGRLLRSGKQADIDLQAFPPGIYFLQLKSIHTFDTIKITKY